MRPLILIIVLSSILAACRTTTTAEVEATLDSLSVSAGEVTHDTLIIYKESASCDSVAGDTRLTVVLSADGDTLRTDKVSERTVTRTKVVTEKVTQMQYRDRWRNVNHRCYVTITKTVTKASELNIWQRIEVAAFWCLLFLIVAIYLTLKFKKYLQK